MKRLFGSFLCLIVITSCIPAFGVDEPIKMTIRTDHGYSEVLGTERDQTQDWKADCRDIRLRLCGSVHGFRQDDLFDLAVRKH